jgi:hypothetical protein
VLPTVPTWGVLRAVTNFAMQNDKVTTF